MSQNNNNQILDLCEKLIDPEKLNDKQKEAIYIIVSKCSNGSLTKEEKAKYGEAVLLSSKEFFNALVKVAKYAEVDISDLTEII